MIGEVAAVLSALKALNDGIQTIKQSAGNAGDLQAIIGRFAGASEKYRDCLLYTSPSPRDRTRSRMPSSA